MTISVLLVYLCTSAAMDNCSVWQEGSWTGAAAPVYCTVERDLAEASVLPNQFIRYECETVETEQVAHTQQRN